MRSHTGLLLQPSHLRKQVHPPIAPQTQSSSPHSQAGCFSPCFISNLPFSVSLWTTAASHHHRFLDAGGVLPGPPAVTLLPPKAGQATTAQWRRGRRQLAITCMKKRAPPHLPLGGCQRASQVIPPSCANVFVLGRAHQHLGVPPALGNVPFPVLRNFLSLWSRGHLGQAVIVNVLLLDSGEE